MKDQNSSKAVNDNEILYGLKNDQFQPFFQPKVQNSTKKIYFMINTEKNFFEEKFIRRGILHFT